MSGYGRYILQDCNGNDIQGYKEVSSASECGRLCKNTTGCVGFVFMEKSRTTQNNCNLKSVCEEIVHNEKWHTYKKPEGKKEI